MGWSRFGGLMAGVAAMTVFAEFSHGWVKTILIAAAFVCFAAAGLGLVHDLWSRPRLKIDNWGPRSRQIQTTQHTEFSTVATSTSDFAITAVSAIPPPGAENVREFVISLLVTRPDGWRRRSRLPTSP
jgi:hypothetical protein